MVVEISALTLIAAVAAFLLAPAATMLIDAWWGHRRPRSAAEAIGIAAVAAGCWTGMIAITTPELEPLLVLPVAGLAGLAAVLASIPLRGRGIGVLLVFSALWTVAVFSPVAVAVFSATDGLLGAGLGTLDLGGALPVLVAAGSAGAMILVMERRAPIETLDRPRASVAPVFAAVWLLWVLWLVGVELVIDELTPSIVANAIIAPIVATIAWLVVQRIRHAKTTTLGAVGGLFCGLVAVTAGCGFLNPLGAALTGGTAGLICSLAGYGLVRRTGRAAWLLVTVLVCGASIGVVLLGALATRSGLMFTGQPEVLFSQFASVAAVVAYSSIVSLVLWSGVRAGASGIDARRASRSRA